MAENEGKTEEKAEEEEKSTSVPKILGQINKIKDWIDVNGDKIESLKEGLGDGHGLVKDFMDALISGKPDLAKQVLTEFADVNELVINEAELAALGTGPDYMALVSTMWKGFVLVAKIAAQVSGIPAPPI